MPEVGVYESAEVNAFATGPSKSRSLVAVSSGLLRAMRQDEVEGVLAHEVTHIANGDMVTMTLLQGVMNAFVMFLARVIASVVTRSDDDRRGDGGDVLPGRDRAADRPRHPWSLITAGSRGIASSAQTRRRHLAGRERMLGALRRLAANREAGRHAATRRSPR